MKSKRISKRTKGILQSIIFFISTIGIISCLILYLWIYTEIDETSLFIEIQTSTIRELENEIYELKSSIEIIKSRRCYIQKSKKGIENDICRPRNFKYRS